MKNSGSPPPAPDPTQTANAQSQSNIATAIANAQLNRVNQVTPWGSITYTQGPAGANGVPTWSSQIQLSPAQQAMLEQQQQQQLARGQIAQELLGNVGGSLGKPLDLSSLQPLYMPTGTGTQHTTFDWHVPATQGMTMPAVPSASASSAGASPAVSTTAPSAASSPAAPSGAMPSPAALSLAQMLKSGAQSPDASTAVPTYQDYLNANPQMNGGSEGGQGTSSAMSQDMWNSLSPALQWNNVGNGMALQSNDPRYAAIAQQMGITPNTGSYDPANTIQLAYKPGSYDPSNSAIYSDPNKILQDGDVYATTHGNLTPYAQMGNNGGMSDAMWALAALSPIMAGVGAAALGAGAGDAGAGAAAGAGDESAGLSMANPFTGSAAAGGPDYASELAGLQGGSQAAAPVTELSTQAAQQGMWSQMLQNLQNGRGLLGMSPLQRAGAGAALSALLQRPAQSGGGGK